jgi:hypothetical protein
MSRSVPSHLYQRGDNCENFLGYVIPSWRGYGKNNLEAANMKPPGGLFFPLEVTYLCKAGNKPISDTI